MCLPLSQRNWPALMQLDQSNSEVHAEVMALLANGNWPQLRQIQFSFNPTLDAVATAHLSAAKWSLRNLDLSHLTVSAAMAAQLQLSNLTTIFLTKNGLTAAAVSGLSRAD